MSPAAASYVTEEMERGFHLIPQHMQDGIKLYVLNGVPPGSFLAALLSNDFMDAVGRADAENAAALFGWGRFLYSYVPCGCHGSPENYRAWLAKGGVVGAEQVPA